MSAWISFRTDSFPADSAMLLIRGRSVETGWRVSDDLRESCRSNMLLIPGVFIFLAGMAWNVLGDGLRDAADPRTLG